MRCDARTTTVQYKLRHIRFRYAFLLLLASMAKVSFLPAQSTTLLLPGILLLVPSATHLHIKKKKREGERKRECEVSLTVRSPPPPDGLRWGVFVRSFFIVWIRFVYTLRGLGRRNREAVALTSSFLCRSVILSL